MLGKALGEGAGAPDLGKGTIPVKRKSTIYGVTLLTGTTYGRIVPSHSRPAAAEVTARERELAVAFYPRSGVPCQRLGVKLTIGIETLPACVS